MRISSVNSFFRFSTSSTFLSVSLFLISAERVFILSFKYKVNNSLEIFPISVACLSSFKNFGNGKKNRYQKTESILWEEILKIPLVSNFSFFCKIKESSPKFFPETRFQIYNFQINFLIFFQNIFGLFVFED